MMNLPTYGNFMRNPQSYYLFPPGPIGTMSDPGGGLPATAGAAMSVIPPEDKNLKKTIEKTAEYCVHNPLLEETVRYRNAHDPNFQFLFGGTGYEYYSMVCRNLRLSVDQQSGESPLQQQQQQQVIDSHWQQPSPAMNFNTNGFSHDSTSYNLYPASYAAPGGPHLATPATAPRPFVGHSGIPPMSTLRHSPAPPPFVQNTISPSYQTTGAPPATGPSAFSRPDSTRTPFRSDHPTTVPPQVSSAAIGSVPVGIQFLPPTNVGGMSQHLTNELNDLISSATQGGNVDDFVLRGRNWIEVNVTSFPLSSHCAFTLRHAMVAGSNLDLAGDRPPVPSSTASSGGVECSATVDLGSSGVPLLKSASSRMYAMRLINSILIHEARRHPQQLENRSPTISPDQYPHAAAFSPHLPAMVRSCLKVFRREGSSSVENGADVAKTVDSFVKGWIEHGIVDRTQWRELEPLIASIGQNALDATPLAATTAQPATDALANNKMLMRSSRFDQGPPPPPPSTAPVEFVVNLPSSRNPLSSSTSKNPPPPLHPPTTSESHPAAPPRPPPSAPVLPAEDMPTADTPAGVCAPLVSPETVSVGLMATMLKQISRRGKNLQTAFVPYRPLLDALLTPSSIPPIDSSSEYILERVKDFYDDWKDAEERIDKEERRKKREERSKDDPTGGGSAPAPSGDTHMPRVSGSTNTSSGGVNFRRSHRGRSRSASISEGGHGGGRRSSPIHSRRHSRPSRRRSPSPPSSSRWSPRDRSRSHPRRARRRRSWSAECDSKPVAWAQAEMGTEEDGSVASGFSDRAGLGATTESENDVFETYRRRRASKYHLSIAQAQADRKTGGGTEDRAVCFVCQQTGHFARDCKFGLS